MTKFQKTFKQVIHVADIVRPGYKDSLGKGVRREVIKQKLSASFEQVEDIPEIYFEIYELIGGTPREIQNQKLMDFIPGYYLITLDELPSLIEKFYWKPSYFPILSNYSSDFVCFSTNEANGIFLAAHDEPEIEKIHNNSLDFAQTILEFYQQNVYFLDEDGYLESNDDKEDEIGQKINPKIDYWIG
ncbi:MAG: SMI1/KNR4 family protein [Thiomicrorhabdus sp.]|nr:SMI1/KNR4 family protein [Thiomicrorhabdus sp.]